MGYTCSMDSIVSIRKNLRILVGVTGGISAYKSPDLIRRLKERGAEVRVVMTDAACEFITPLTLQAVSGHPVFRRLLDTEAESGMGHIEIARWAELVVIAPATANFMANLASGRAQDLLETVVLAASAEVVIAPAMNQQMWQQTATQENLKTLQRRGIRVVGPGSGDQACGENGPGRMAEPDEIADQLLGDGTPVRFAGKRVVVTAGPTWEEMDPVRGITNRSSGKMGFALAAAASDLGAVVTLISGPVHLRTPDGVTRIDIRSAQQMFDGVMQHIDDADIFIAVAAVSDYRPVIRAAQKIKKREQRMTVDLVRNPDILATVASLDSRPFTVGFAAETEQVEKHAREKLVEKGVDMIVANQVAGQESPFGSDSNAVTVHHRLGDIPLQRTDKYGLSVRLMEIVHDLMSRREDPDQQEAATAGRRS